MNLRRIQSASLLVTLLATSLFAENRQALLIANGTYANFGSLGTPVAEAVALGATLQKLGFEVAVLKNGSREAMLDALDAFGAKFKGKGGVAFFHYGGHGVQVAGRNYLIPVDADIPDERKAATRAVDVDEVMSTLEACGSDTNIVVLGKPKNSVIVYAAEANSTAQDGLFTPTLTATLAKPGLSLSDVFTEVRRVVYEKSKGAQTPGEYNQLFQPVYLAGMAKTAPVASAPASTPSFGVVTVAPGALSISTKTG